MRKNEDTCTASAAVERPDSKGDDGVDDDVDEKEEADLSFLDFFPGVAAAAIDEEDDDEEGRANKASISASLPTPLTSRFTRSA